MSSLLVTKKGKHQVNKISDFKFQIFKDESRGMNIPVTIYANDLLISKMVEDLYSGPSCKCNYSSWSQKTYDCITRWT